VAMAMVLALALERYATAGSTALSEATITQGGGSV